MHRGTYTILLEILFQLPFEDTRGSVHIDDGECKFACTFENGFAILHEGKINLPYMMSAGSGIPFRSLEVTPVSVESVKCCEIHAQINRMSIHSNVEFQLVSGCIQVQRSDLEDNSTLFIYTG